MVRLSAAAPSWLVEAGRGWSRARGGAALRHGPAPLSGRGTAPEFTTGPSSFRYRSRPRPSPLHACDTTDQPPHHAQGHRCRRRSRRDRGGRRLSPRSSRRYVLRTSRDAPHQRRPRPDGRQGEGRRLPLHRRVREADRQSGMRGATGRPNPQAIVYRGTELRDPARGSRTTRTLYNDIHAAYQNALRWHDQRRHRPRRHRRANPQRLVGEADEGRRQRRPVPGRRHLRVPVRQRRRAHARLQRTSTSTRFQKMLVDVFYSAERGLPRPGTTAPPSPTTGPTGTCATWPACWPSASSATTRPRSSRPSSTSSTATEWARSSTPSRSCTPTGSPNGWRPGATRATPCSASA